MAGPKPAAPMVAPDYGALKPQVIDFLRQLLIYNHKPEKPIGIWAKDGKKRLGIRCVNCKQYVIVPVDGPIELPWCAPPAAAKGGA
jgi:hypothetical protein